VIRRVSVAAAVGVALVFVATVWAGGSSPSCSLDPMTAAAGQVDALSGVAPFGGGALVIGTRFSGSVGGGLEATATADGTYDAHPIDVFGHRVVELDDVATDGSQAWAVGAFSNTAPVAAHWDGSSWSAMPIADPGPTEDGLSGVTAVGADEIWAVGRHQVGQDFVTLIERSKGTSWVVEPSPNAGSSDMLKDVASFGSHELWAVGWSEVGGSFRPLTMHRVGSTWTIVPTPPLGKDGILAAVAVPGPDEAWAVGWSGRGDDVRPLVERWDGNRWSVVPPPGRGRGALLAVATTPGGVVVAGRRTPPDGQPQPLAAFRTDATWSDASATIAGSAWLTAITVDDTGRVWGAGASFPSNAVVTGLVVTGCPQR
jgi:hypothetical protein